MTCPPSGGADGFVGYTDPAAAVAEVEEGVYRAWHAARHGWL
ncbi:hypothetical protein [Streptomyces globisporus]